MNKKAPPKKKQSKVVGHVLGYLPVYFCITKSFVQRLFAGVPTGTKTLFL